MRSFTPPIKQTPYFRTLILLLFAGLILTIPLHPRWSNYFLLLLGVLAVVHYFVFRTVEQIPRFFYFLIAAYVVRLAWIIFAVDFKYALRCLETESPVAAIPLLFLFLPVEKKSKALLSKAYVLMATAFMVYSFVTLFLYIYYSEFTIFNYWETHFWTAQYFALKNMIQWSFAHYSFLCMLAIYGLALLMFTQTFSALTITFAIFYNILVWAFVILTGSLSGVAILLGFYLLVAAIYTWKRWGLRVVVVTAGVAFFAILSIVWLNRQKFENPKKVLFELDAQRYQLFVVAIDAFERKPVLGYGTGGQRIVVKDSVHALTLGFPFKDYPGRGVNHPHNQILTELIQFGIIGSIPLMLFILYALRYSWIQKNWQLLIVLYMGFTFMLVEAPLNSNKGVLPFLLLVCLLAAESKPADMPPQGKIDT